MPPKNKWIEWAHTVDAGPVESLVPKEEAKSTSSSKWVDWANGVENNSASKLESNEEELTWKETIKRGILEIPADTKEYGKNLVGGIKQIIDNPKETAQAGLGLIKAGVGAEMKVLKHLPGFKEKYKENPELDAEREALEGMAEQVAGAVWQSYKDKYGTVENFKKTLAKDPITGVASDLSIALQGLGVLSKSGKLAELGRTLEPIHAATKVATRAIPKGVSPWLYKSAVKFSSKLPTKERNELANIGIKNGVVPSLNSTFFKGMYKLRDDITNLNSEIDKLVDAATASGDKIPVGRMVREFNKLIKNQAFTGEPSKYRRQIRNIRKQLLDENVKIDKRGQWTPREAQEFKKELYSEVEKFYNIATKSSATVKAKKLLAKNAKESLEFLIPSSPGSPGIKALNKKESALIKLYNQIIVTANGLENKDLVNLGIPIGTAVGAASFNKKGLVAMMTLGLMDSSAIKSRLAIVLDRLKNKGVKMDENWPIFRLGLAEYGDYTEEQKEQ